MSEREEYVTTLERDCHVLRLRAENAEAALLAAELRAKYAERLNDDYATKAVGGLMARGEATERAELAERELAEARVRAAESYAAGRAAGLREAAGVCHAIKQENGDDPRVWLVDYMEECEQRILALAPPAAETPPAGVGHALSLGVCCAACYRDGQHSAPFRPMILCPKCGNKRCPRAGSHANACTNSNEPGQVATPAADPRDEGEVSGG